jgi:YD repeat-containing protein
MVYYYDGFGRVKSVMGPNEIASGSTVPTVAYRYWFDHAGIPNNDATVKVYRASTANFDPDYATAGNKIMTETYSDFLGRAVQVKKDIEQHGAESRSVSGKKVYDNLGRVIRQYHPTFEAASMQNFNTATGYASTSQLGNGMGGMFLFGFKYDTLNRLIGTGSEKVLTDGENQPIPVTMNVPTSYTLQMKYNESGGIILKSQFHERDQNVVHENTYDNKYDYIPKTHQVAAVIDGASGNVEKFEYDLDGNPVRHIDPNGEKQMFWDEQDHMKAFYDDNSGIYQYHVYDDKGERTIRYGLERPAHLYQNGELINPDDLRLIDYKIYPNPYVTVSSTGQYTKHYFEGSKRFASRLLDNASIFETPPTTTKMADQTNKKETVDPEVDFKAYLKKAGLGKDISTELRETNQTPGLYYLHGDHLGTSTFVTNNFSVATQFFVNLPFGETMLEQMDGSYNNPRLSIWYGVDSLTEKMPNWSPYNYTLYKASSPGNNLNFRRSSELKKAVENFNKANTR